MEVKTWLNVWQLLEKVNFACVNFFILIIITIILETHTNKQNRLFQFVVSSALFGYKLTGL